MPKPNLQAAPTPEEDPTESPEASDELWEEAEEEEEELEEEDEPRESFEDRRTREEETKEPVEARFARTFARNPDAYTHVCVFKLSHKSARRGAQQWPRLDFSAAKDLAPAIAKEHGPGWWDVALYNERIHKWGTQGRIEVEALPTTLDTDKKPAPGPGGLDVAGLFAAGAAGQSELASAVVLKMLDHNIARERTQDEELRRARDEAFSAAQRIFDRETTKSAIADVFEGLATVASVVMDKRAERIDAAAPEAPGERDTKKETASLLIDAIEEKWAPPVVLSALRAMYGAKELQKMLANLPALVQGCAERVPKLEKLLRTDEGRAWAAGMVQYLTSDEPEGDPEE